MAVEFRPHEACGFLQVDVRDLGGGRRTIGVIDLAAVQFRPRGYFQPLEAEELERIAERIHSIRRKRRQALREANDGRGV